MKTITLVQQKGGVGKTTLALNIALHVAGQGASVAVADADPQGSIRATSDLFEGLQLVPIETVLKARVSADLLVIDTSPRNDAHLVKLLQLTDFALIPVKPGYFDVLALNDTLALIAQARTQRTLKVGIVLNMVKHRNAVNRDIRKLLADSAHDIELLPTGIHDRVAYSRTTLTNGVMGSTDEKAKAELDQLVTEIFDRL